MKRSDHFNVVSGKWLNVFPLSVDGHKYFMSGVNSDNKLVLHCSDAKGISCDYSDLFIGSSHIFVNDCGHELYVVNKGDEWRSCWVEDSYVIGSSCCTIRSISDFLRGKSRFFCGDEPVPFLANWKIGTYGFAKDKFPFIVPFHKFNPDNIGKSLQYNVIKQQ